MKWSSVGKWLKGNSGKGVSLIGSLLTGNVSGAVAAGISLVSSATGSDSPSEALNRLNSDPATMIKLKKLYYENEDSVRKHLEEMTRIKLEDLQKEHNETQKTVRAGDKAEDWFVRRTRPAQSWISLAAALYYALAMESPDFAILGALLALPWAYAGLRQVGKGITAVTEKKAQK